LNIVFFGSSEISVPFLEGIYSSRHKISLVVTTADKPAGRGRKTVPNIVRKKAAELGVELIQIEKFDDFFLKEFKKLKFDAAVVVSFGRIFPEGIFKLTAARWFNMHPSLLPRYRGPTPIISTLLNGDDVGGISIIEVVNEVDAGGIYAQVKFRVEKDDNGDSLEQKSIKFGIPLIIAVLDLVESKNLKPYPQDSDNIVYSHKITKEDLKINWNTGALEIINKIRALSLKPGAYCLWRNLRIKILKAAVIDKDIYPYKPKATRGDKNGSVVEADREKGILIKCSENKIVRIELLQPQGKKAMSAADFINGYRLKAGESFE